VPTGLTAAEVRGKVQLTWQAATDNVALGGYTVWRNGGKIGTTANTSFTDSAISSGSTYTYFVVASDAAGNVSGASNTAMVTISSSTKGGGKGRK
jgi:chitodextrinase